MNGHVSKQWCAGLLQGEFDWKTFKADLRAATDLEGPFWSGYLEGQARAKADEQPKPAAWSKETLEDYADV